MLLLHSPPHQIIVNIMCDFISDIPKNYLPYSAKKSIFCEISANKYDNMINKYEWLTCHLTFTSKGGTPCLELSTFFVICGNLLKFTKLILPEADFDGFFPGKVHKISGLMVSSTSLSKFFYRSNLMLTILCGFVVS